MADDVVDNENEYIYYGNEDDVLGNRVIADLICSFMSSDDLVRLRLVNRLFQTEATAKLRMVHKHVHLSTEVEMKSLLECLSNRAALGLVPFPFSAFGVDVEVIDLKLLERFAASVGEHVIEYSVYRNFNCKSRENQILNTGGRIAMLLSQSPQLKEFQIYCTREIFVSEEHLGLLPTSFPRLNVIEMANGDDDRRYYTPKKSHPLIDVMICRAPQLKTFQLPGNMEYLNIRIIRSLLQNRPGNLPSFRLAHDFCVTAADAEFFQQLMDLPATLHLRPLRFTSISIAVDTRSGQPLKLQTTINTLTSWFQRQENSQSLTDLSIRTDDPQGRKLTLQLPSFRALRNLSINFKHEYYHRGMFNILVDPSIQSSPIQPFTINQFPSLQKVCLQNYNEAYQMFRTVVMDTVKELQLIHLSSIPRNPTWHLGFPFLVTLHVAVDTDQGTLFRSVLTYILTHFTRLVNLDLEVTEACRMYSARDVSSTWDYWNLLTGRANRSLRNSGLSDQDLRAQAVAAIAEEPLNGIYRVPSLRNMTELKTLSFFPRLRSNLDALLYMSRAGLLVPLEKLTLRRLSGEFMNELKNPYALVLNLDTEPYEDGLSRTHKEVIFRGPDYERRKRTTKMKQLGLTWVPSW